MIARLRQQFDEMELSNRLGYIWLLSFFLMVFAVAAAILIPKFSEETQEAAPAAEEEENSMRQPPLDFRVSIPSQAQDGPAGGKRA